MNHNHQNTVTASCSCQRTAFELKGVNQKYWDRHGYLKYFWVQVGAVVVGFDRHINYYKIQTAQLCIDENPGCLFIATNLDAKTHLTDAQEWAGNGAMVGAIKGISLTLRVYIIGITVLCSSIIGKKRMQGTYTLRSQVA